MCTLTYIPAAEGQYIFTTNRDEMPARAGSGLKKEQVNGVPVLFPPDAMAGGTWFASGSDDRSVCLINGAFERHDRNPPYRRSRGLMVLDFFEHHSVQAFVEHYPFHGIEPFTLVTVERGSLWDIRWDGDKLHRQDLDPAQYHLWASTMLYSREVRKKRALWFAEWLEQDPTPSPEAILGFHRTAGDGDPRNDLVMNRDGLVRTVSITSTFRQQEAILMRQFDLLREKEEEAVLPIDWNGKFGSK